MGVRGSSIACRRACGYYAVCTSVTLKGSGSECPKAVLGSHVHHPKPHHQEQQVEECGSQAEARVSLSSLKVIYTSSSLFFIHFCCYSFLSFVYVVIPCSGYPSIPHLFLLLISLSLVRLCHYSLIQFVFSLVCVLIGFLSIDLLHLVFLDGASIILPLPPNTVHHFFL